MGGSLAGSIFEEYKIENARHDLKQAQANSQKKLLGYAVAVFLGNLMTVAFLGLCYLIVRAME